MNKITLYIADKNYNVEQREEGLMLDGKYHDVNIHKITENEYSVLIDGRSHHIFFNSCLMCFCARIDNRIYQIKRHTLRDQLSEKILLPHDEHKSVTFFAPMPGLVTKLIKPLSSLVNHGEGVMIVEAMKMENEIKTNRTGKVTKIFVEEKQAVEKGDPLFIIE